MPEIYGLYAAGRLSPAFTLMLQTQANIRRDIAADLHICETVASVMLEREDEELLSPNAFEAALHAIDAHEADSKTIDLTPRETSEEEALRELAGLPEPLREHARSAFEGSGWKALKKGVRRLDLSQNSYVKAHLYRIEPGASVPHHTHKGDEFTLVVQGGFTDETGSYGPGDVARQTTSDFHMPVADDDGVCFVLAVSEGGMKFSGLLGIVQKLSGR